MEATLRYVGSEYNYDSEVLVVKQEKDWDILTGKYVEGTSKVVIS
jgi:hypothetical protein